MVMDGGMLSGTIESVDGTDTPPHDAVSVACAGVVTAVVVIVNVTDVWPAGMVTVCGTVAAAEDDVRLTTAPPGAAGRPHHTVPVTGCPPAAGGAAEGSCFHAQ